MKTNIQSKQNSKLGKDWILKVYSPPPRKGYGHNNLYELIRTYQNAKKRDLFNSTVTLGQGYWNWNGSANNDYLGKFQKSL